MAKPQHKLKKANHGRRPASAKAQGKTQKDQDLSIGLFAVVNNELIVDLSLLDFDNPIADLEAIRKLNRQRFEMEQLTAFLYENLEAKTCAGYLQTSEDSFWARGHMPGMPLMPGVIMLEAVAQLSSFFTQRQRPVGCRRRRLRRRGWGPFSRRRVTR